MARQDFYCESPRKLLATIADSITARTAGLLRHSFQALYSLETAKANPLLNFTLQSFMLFNIDGCLGDG
jgi:hypothetical protein